jgi:hypothetical protein
MIRTAPRGETVVMSSPSEPVRYRLLDLVLERGLLPDGPERDARAPLATWRLFLISTQEIWGYRHGNRWLVSHYLLEPLAS